MSERDGNPELYLIPAAGGVARRLTRDPGADVHPAWSSDGRRLAFDSDRHGPAEVYVMDIADGALRRITSNGFADVFPIWAPGDTMLVVSSNRRGQPELYLLGLDGTYRDQLTTSAPGDMDWKAAWSPDGRALAFASARGRNFDLYIRKMATGRVARVTEGSSVERYPVWSPKGDRLAYMSNASGRLEVYYWDLTRWRPVQVTGVHRNPARGDSR